MCLLSQGAAHSARKGTRKLVCDMSHSLAPTTGAEQSHYLEVMLRARIWPPVARHACRHYRAHLSCACQPSALPPSFAPPSLHVLGSMSESCVPEV